MDSPLWTKVETFKANIWNQNWKIRHFVFERDLYAFLNHMYETYVTCFEAFHRIEVMRIRHPSSQTITLKRLGVMRIRHESLENVLFVWFRLFSEKLGSSNTCSVLFRTSDFEIQIISLTRKNVVFFGHPRTIFLNQFWWSYGYQHLQLAFLQPLVASVGLKNFKMVQDLYYKNSVWSWIIKPNPFLKNSKAF